jgi:hypothetical protein
MLIFIIIIITNILFSHFDNYPGFPSPETSFLRNSSWSGVKIESKATTLNGLIFICVHLRWTRAERLKCINRGQYICGELHSVVPPLPIKGRQTWQHSENAIFNATHLFAHTLCPHRVPFPCFSLLILK